MLIRNLNIHLNLCNGTRLKITKLMDTLIEAEDLFTNKKCLIPRIPLTSNETGYPLTLKRIQFPFRLAYATTINKSQGQTYDKVGLYLNNQVFDHGQLYVAFSRVKLLEDIKVYIKNTFTQGILTSNLNEFFTTNIVYRDILGINSNEQIEIDLNDFEISNKDYIKNFKLYEKELLEENLTNNIDFNFDDSLDELYF